MFKLTRKNRKNLFLILCIFALIYLYQNDTIETYMIDYAKQPFKYRIAEKHWKQAHDYKMKELSENAYYNFDGSYIANPKDTLFPKDVQEVKDIINDARTTKRKIRVSGGHHTFSDISITNDIIIRTFNFKDVLKLDKQRMRVTVEAGILLEELNIYLYENGLSLPVLPSIQYQSIGGCIATSTHGSNSYLGSMSSLIKDITIIQANGLMKTYYGPDDDFPGDQFFSALITNLGCLGFIYSVTLQCEPLFIIEHTKRETSWRKFLEDFQALREAYEYLQVYIWPFSDRDNNCELYLRRKVRLKDIDRKELERENDRKYLPIKQVKQMRNYSHLILTRNQESGFYTESEYCLDLKHMVPAVREAMNLLKSYQINFNYTTKYPILLRFAKGDNSLIGLNSGRTNNFYINTYNDGHLFKDDLVIKFFQDLELLMVEDFDGRPHYGKKNWLDAGKMDKLYGQRFRQFQKVRRQLDPFRLFSNDFINRLFGT